MRLHRSMMLSLALVLPVAMAACATIEALVKEQKRPDVPYVSTPEQVVVEMLRVANVTKEDVLYDLGSGDGRIVITAAKEYGARGTGIELDPERVREARENARKAGVADRVRFIEGDIFEADISDATVVTLYLLPEVNLKLRPKLLSELQRGTRVVSHNYDMGDWKPEKTIRVSMPGVEHTVYVWVIPPRAASK